MSDNVNRVGRFVLMLMRSLNDLSERRKCNINFIFITQLRTMILWMNCFDFFSPLGFSGSSVTLENKLNFNGKQWTWSSPLHAYDSA